MPLRRLLVGATFSPEEVTAMATAYETIRQQLHDRGQPVVVNEVIAKRIVEFAKTKPLNAEDLASQALASFGLAN